MAKENQQGRKPLESMSLWERDRYLKEYADLSDEQKQFAADYGEAEKREAIFDHISRILKVYSNNGGMQNAQVILCHTSWKKEAEFVRKHFCLQLVADDRLEEKEIYICSQKNVNKLIILRGMAKETRIKYGSSAKKVIT